MKDRRFESPKLRKAARDQACVNCGRQDGTVVLAHMPHHAITGNGMGLKCSDHWGAWLCANCHSEADQGEYRDDLAWRSRMVYRTLQRLFHGGVVK